MAHKRCVHIIHMEAQSSETLVPEFLVMQDFILQKPDHMKGECRL